MKKVLATILTGISLAYGNISRANDLPTQIEPQNGRYYTTDQITLEVKDMALRKVIDKIPQPVFMQGNYTPDGRISISYSTHPFEEKATRPKQGFASNSKIYVGVPEGTKLELILQKAETIGNFDKVTEEDLKPLEETKYAKTFLKMGNNGIEKLRGYDPIQKATETLNGSIFLLTGTDLNLEDRISIYGGLKAFSDHLTTQEKERGKATFKGELELQEIPLYPHDGIVQPSETKRKIMFRIKPGTYQGDKIPFTVYQKLVLGREPTQGIGKLETFFSGEIDNPNSQQTDTGKQLGIIEALSGLEGYWKLSEDPQGIANYVEVTQRDQKNVKFRVLMSNPNNSIDKEEAIISFTYDSERKTLELLGIEGDRIKQKKNFYEVRRLSEEERKRIEK